MSAAEPPLARLLAGIRVLDLTNVLSGPYTTWQLASLGADVIKVENPQGGDLARQLGASPELNAQMMGTSFLAQNAGKRSVTLDLKQTDNAEAFKHLVKTADVVVENFRPGVMDRLGLGFEVLSAINPALVYCAISGFGQDGPWRDNPAYDQIVQGLSGVMSITGDADSAPLRVGYPLCDTLGGLSAAFAIVSSLYERHSSGKGRFIDVSMLDTQLSALGWVVANYLLAGRTPQPLGNENMTAAPSGTFACADSPLNIAANKQEQFHTLCRLIGRDDLINNPLFAERETRKANRAALNPEIEKGLATRSAAEWEIMFNQAGVPAGRVLSVPDILGHEQITGRHTIQTIQQVPADIQGIEAIRLIRPGFRFSDGLPGADRRPPFLGEHNAEILGTE